jgi:hypothetical protein
MGFSPAAHATVAILLTTIPPDASRLLCGEDWCHEIHGPFMPVNIETSLPPRPRQNVQDVRKSKSILPPRKFDHLYGGNIRVKRDSAWIAPCRPISLSGRLDCPFPPDKPGEECFVFIALPEEIEEAGYTENAVWRNVMGRCNGWQGRGPLLAACPCEGEEVGLLAEGACQPLQERGANEPLRQSAPDAGS